MHLTKSICEGTVASSPSSLNSSFLFLRRHVAPDANSAMNSMSSRRPDALYRSPLGFECVKVASGFTVGNEPKYSKKDVLVLYVLDGSIVADASGGTIPSLGGS